MTINLSDNIPRQEYTVAQGVTQTAFVVSFEWFDDADLNVYVNGVLQTLTTDYTTAADAANTLDHVSGSDGYVHFVEDVTGISGGTTVVITRSIDIERTTDFPASGAFQIDALNVGLDKIIGMTADIDNVANRSLRLKDYDVTSTDMTIPVKADRVGRVLGFNETTGQPQAGPEIADVESLAAVTADIARLADIEDGTLATDAIQTVASNATNINTVANNLTDINSFAETYFVGATAPSSPTEGDLWFDTTNNIMKVYDGSGFISTSSSDISNDTTPELGGDLSTSGNDIVFDDFNRAIFGNDSDLQIYNNGNNNYIRSDNVTGGAQGAGALIIQAESLTNKIVSSGGAIYTRIHADSSGVELGGPVDVSGILSVTSTNPNIRLFESDTTNLNTQLNHNIGRFSILTANDAANAGSTRFEIDHSTGDISFYSDSGNQRLLWDASEERLGIGNNSPTEALDVTGNISVSGTVDGRDVATDGTKLDGIETGADVTDTANVTAAGAAMLTGANFTGNVDVTGTITADGLTISTSDPYITLTDSDTGVDHEIDGQSGIGNLAINVDKNSEGSNSGFVVNVKGNQYMRVDDGGDISFYEDTGATAKFFWDASAEALGIGTASPSRQVHISGSGANTRLRVENTTGSNVLDVYAEDGGNSTLNYSSVITMSQSGTERMRIDSSGNLLVGKTSLTNSVAGVELNSTGQLVATFSGGTHVLGRNSTDGSILQFNKDATVVGSIGAEFGDLIIDGETNHTGLRFYSTFIGPRFNGSVSNNTVDLGNDNYKFKDLYLSGSIDAGGPIEISATSPTIRLFETDTTNLNTQIQNNGGSFTILTTNDAVTSGSTRFGIDHSTGDISFYSSSGNADLVWDASSSNLVMSDAGNITKASHAGENTSMYIGRNAGINSPTTISAHNTFIGNEAGTSATGTINSTFIGSQSGDVSGFTGDDLTMVGHETDGMNNAVTDSVFIGYRARGGSYGVSVGHLSQYSGSSGSLYCTTIGRESGYDFDGGDYCVFAGYRSGYAGGSGNDNIGIGSFSMDALTSGYDNTCMGHSAGGAVTNGYNNVCIGHTSGTAITSGNTIVCLGHDTGSLYAGSSNCTNLGNEAQAPSNTSTNTITLGNTSVSSLRCNVTSISSLSDERDKTAIEDIPYGLDFINAMRPVQFTWNRRDGSMGAAKDIGFIAQELAEVEMDFSSTSRTKMVSFEDPEKWEAAPNRTYPILIKAVQELSAKCEALEARIQQLEQGN